MFSLSTTATGCGVVQTTLDANDNNTVVVNRIGGALYGPICDRILRLVSQQFRVVLDGRITWCVCGGYLRKTFETIVENRINRRSVLLVVVWQCGVVVVVKTNPRRDDRDQRAEVSGQGRRETGKTHQPVEVHDILSERRDMG